MSIFKRKINSKLILAILITVAIGLLYSLISGFRYTYMTNDDYMISLMISGGDNKCIFANYFLTALFVPLQRLFPSINCFAISEWILCIISIVVINYVFITRFNKALGMFFSIIVSVMIYGASVIMIQYTQTTTIACSAGVLLLCLSFLYEIRKRYQILQRIIAVLLIIIGSLYRIESFYLLCLATLLLFFCFLIKEVSKRYFEIKQLGKSIVCSIKKNSKMIISFVLVFSVALGLGVLSDKLKNQDPNYVRHKELGLGRQYVTDYYVAPYQDNKDFYHSIGIDSEADFNLMTAGYIDKDYMTAEKMIAVGDYSIKDQLNNQSKIGFAIKQTLNRVNHAAKRIYSKLLKIKQYLSLEISNMLFFIILSLVMLLILLTIIALVIRSIKKRIDYVSITLKLILILIWIIFFEAYRLDIKNILLLLAFLVAAFVVINSGKENILSGYLFSLFLMGIYCYQICFRLNFRAVFTFAFPGILFLLFLYEGKGNKGNRTGENQNENIMNIVPIIVAILVVASTAFAGVKVWYELYVPQTASDDDMVSNYFTENMDKHFVHVISANSVIDNGYYNIFSVPQLADNSILYGSWCISSNYYDELLENNGIDNLFSQMKNNNDYLLLLQLDDGFDVVKDYEEYLNNHYSKPGKSISLSEEREIESKIIMWGNNSSKRKIGIYRIIES